MCTDNSSSCFVTKPRKEIEQELRKERAKRQHERKARMFCATGNNPVTSEDRRSRDTGNAVAMSWGRRVGKPLWTGLGLLHSGKDGRSYVCSANKW